MNKVKQYRQQAKLTQEELARICDTTLNNIQKIESGKSNPGIYLAIKIKKALNVATIEELFPD